MWGKRGVEKAEPGHKKGRGKNLQDINKRDKAKGGQKHRK